MSLIRTRRSRSIICRLGGNLSTSSFNYLIFLNKKETKFGYMQVPITDFRMLTHNGIVDSDPQYDAQYDDFGIYSMPKGSEFSVLLQDGTKTVWPRQLTLDPLSQTIHEVIGFNFYLH